MSEIAKLSPVGVWSAFDLICSVPHPSGHEEALFRKLEEFADVHHLAHRRDAAGNLRIDRPASPGFENAKRVIIQNHADMVPASTEPFDFVTTPITPVIDGDVVRACGTTLGADDGIGGALALAALCDESLKTGPLSALFTFQEETGMHGAAALDPAMLADCAMLLSLDHGGEVGLGCAGGARTEFTFIPQWEPAPAGHGIRITIRGLRGGHSGNCIADRRGNALRFLADYLDQHPEVRLSAISGGNADNAIPATATATGVTAAKNSDLQKSADFITALLRKEFDAPEGFGFDVEDATWPQEVWSAEFQKNLVSGLALVPDGVIEMADDLGIPRTSSNLAAVFTDHEKILVRSSQRSLVDAEREAITARLVQHFANFGATAETTNAYPGWPPHGNSPLNELAIRLWKECTGETVPAKAIHAGIEAGWLCSKNPKMELLAFGVPARLIHTPQEAQPIKPVAVFYDYLLKLLPAMIALEA